MTDSVKDILVDGALEAEVNNEGREASFEALYDSVGVELVQGLRRKFGDGPPDPEDLAQEAFRRLFEHPERSQIKNKRAFLWRTAINMALTSKRTTETHAGYQADIRDVFFPEEGGKTSPQIVLEAKEQLDAICAALEAMPERRRWAVLLRRVDGLTVTQVARRLGISRNAVTKHLARADAEISALFLHEDT